MIKREKEIIENILAVVKEYLSPRAVYLFGSRAKGVHDARADFDIAIDTECPGAEVFQTMKEQLDRVSGLYSVDAQTPREVLKGSFKLHWLPQEDVFIAMLKDRNDLAHTYKEEKAKKVYGHIKADYVDAIEAVYDKLKP